MMRYDRLGQQVLRIAPLGRATIVADCPTEGAAQAALRLCLVEPRSSVDGPYTRSDRVDLKCEEAR